ncbi:hypothetical protein KYC5002_17895 [Archangium violaceum]|uniref:hypothetical protein n=1 Tax=Archangium violaceum TaxID=83451 RepID=UPI002B2DEB6C|nr:hypothetical protein KYC5002_17895 [Archangium gephyra]
MTVMTGQEALAELKKVANSLNTLFATGCSVQNQLGLAYHSALSRRLAETAGYNNAWEYLSQNVKGLTRQTLTAYTDAATYWGSSVTQKYGVERLKLLPRYLRAHPYVGAWPDSDPGFLNIRVPQPDGSVVVKSFADCSLEEMRRAVSPPRPKPAWEGVRRRERLRVLVLKELMPQRFLASAGVRFRAEGERAFVSFQEVPVAELEALIVVLQECIAMEPSSLRAGNP